MPRASDPIAVRVNPGDFAKVRAAYIRSLTMSSTSVTRRVSRHCSLADSIEPNSRRAAARASAGVMPSAMCCFVSCSTWISSSRRRSASTRDGRKSERRRWATILASRTVLGLLRRLDEETNGRRQPLPGLQLALELLPALTRQRVELRVAPEIGRFPLGANPALLLQPVERRVQRPLPHRQGVAGQDLNALRDSPPVQRLARDGLEDQEIERALEQVGRFRHRYLDGRQ